MIGSPPPVARVTYEPDDAIDTMAEVARPKPAARRRSTPARSLRNSRARLIRDLEERWCALSAAMAVFQEHRAERQGLTLSDLQAVDVLARQDAVCATELAEACGLTRGAITGMVDRLERAGVAQRTRDASDARRVVIRATEERPGCACRMPQAFRQVLASFDEDSLEVIGRFLSLSAEALQGEIEQESEK